MKEGYSKYEVWQPFLLAAMVAVGMIIGVKMSDNPYNFIQKLDEDTVQGPIGRVEEVVRFIESKYVDSLNSNRILESAISNIMEDLDPHSVYIDPEQLRMVNEQMNGSYRGVGVESFFIDDTVRISRVLKGSPAEAANIHALDKLIAIDDTIVAGRNLPYSEIREFLRAEDKDEIILTIINSGGEEIKKVIRPSSVNLQSSKVAYMIDEGVGYIKIDRFSSNTYKEFMEALEKLVENENLQNLIIDLRDNPGGYLPETVNILSQLFEDKGKLLVYTQGKNDKKTEYKTTGKNFFHVEKISVLIDEGSASGSEIIAGAIQDWDRGLIVGRRSFGKGLVQEQYPLNNGGAIRLTISRYYTPSGRSIQRPYDDQKSYERDLYNRFHNGELYDPENYENIDTTIFKTKILRRDVFGGGGIFPDVFIPIDSSYSIDNFRLIASYIPEYIFLEREKSGDNLRAADLHVDSFITYLKNKEIAESMTKNLPIEKVLQMQKSELFYQREGEIARDSIMNKDDPFVTKSLEYINSSKTLSDY